MSFRCRLKARQRARTGPGESQNQFNRMKWRGANRRKILSTGEVCVLRPERYLRQRIRKLRLSHSPSLFPFCYYYWKEMKLFARDGERREESSSAMLATKNKQSRLALKCSRASHVCVLLACPSTRTSAAHDRGRNGSISRRRNGKVLSAPLLMHFIIIDTIFPSRSLASLVLPKKTSVNALETRSQLLPRTHDTRDESALHGFLSRRLVEQFSVQT